MVWGHKILWIVSRLLVCSYRAYLPGVPWSLTCWSPTACRQSITVKAVIAASWNTRPLFPRRFQQTRSMASYPGSSEGDVLQPSRTRDRRDKFKLQASSFEALWTSANLCLERRDLYQTNLCSMIHPKSSKTYVYLSQASQQNRFFSPGSNRSQHGHAKRNKYPNSQRYHLLGPVHTHQLVNPWQFGELEGHLDKLSWGFRSISTESF